MDINETKEELEKLHKDFQAWIVKDMFYKQEMLDLMKQLVENTKMEDIVESPAERAWRKMKEEKVH